MPDALVRDVLIEEEMKDSYLTYAMSVIVARALPDVRDGLKPSQRRILVAMQDLGLAPPKKTVKCAGIVGETMKKYHPHGDGAIYPALVRMAQDWSMRYCLIEGQGNFGSIDGDPPAAMRYTEARLDPAAVDMMADLKLDTVRYQPNYDESLTEPTVLPSRFPNLLCNGASGIAVGMATNLPPHNFGEIAAALRALIRDPEITLEELMACVPGPDFPTGGLILGRQGIREAYRTGRGRIHVRARCHFETLGEGKRSERRAIVVTEIPYQVNKTQLIERISEALKQEKVTGVAHVADLSNRHGLRLVLELKRGEDEQVVQNQLFKHTTLQNTFSIINIALVNGRPETLSLKEMLGAYRDHRIEVIRRRTQHLLEQARQRAHVLEGYLLALDHIDEIIALIRAAPDTERARADLRARFTLSEIQAQSILDMPLKRLTGLEREKIQQEYDEQQRLIADYQDLLARRERVLGLILDDLTELEKRFRDGRRSEIVDDEADLDLEDIIADETVCVILSHEGYAKRLPLETYRRQARGGRGVSGMSTKEGDWIEDLFVASTKDFILFFTNRGKVYWLKVYHIPEQSRAARGKHLVNLLHMEPGETVSAYVQVQRFDGRNLLFVTRRGLVKKTPLAEYGRPRASGIRAIVLDDDDELIDCRLTNGQNEVILATAGGMAIRFAENDVRPMGRVARGVIGIRLKDGDRVVGSAVPNRAGTLLTVCERGHGKRTHYDEYRVQKRGGQGLIDIKTTARNGPALAVLNVNEGDDLMMITQSGMVVRTTVTEEVVRPIGRNTQGVRLIRLKEGDRLIGVARVLKEDADAAVRDEAADDAGGGGGAPAPARGAGVPPAADDGDDADDADADLSRLDDAIARVAIPDVDLGDGEAEDESPDEGDDVRDEDE